MKFTRKWFAGLCIALTLFGVVMIPTKAYADAPDVAYMTIIFEWLQKTMLTWMQDGMIQAVDGIQQKATTAITTQVGNNFHTQTDWENMGASQGAVSTSMVPYETAAHKNSYQNAQSYVGYNYTANSASGVDATKYPVKVINNFNKNHDKVQGDNSQCNIDVPQAIGDASNNCTTEQLTYTNTMLSGVNPIPNFPDSTLKTAIGQQYTSERKAAVVRTALSQLALNEASDPETTKFIVSLQTAFQNPTPKVINGESSAAIARDILILNQARAMLELRIYESNLMNQRLLATLVAQNEENHLDYIRKFGAAQAHALQG